MNSILTGKLRKGSFVFGCIFLIFILFRLLFEDVNLPDYDSYSKIFFEPDKFKGFNIIFTTITLGFSYIFSYEAFRLTVFLLGSFFFVRIHKIGFRASLLPLIFISCIVLLEFYMIRMRAGLCILVFYAAYTFYGRSRVFLSSTLAVLSMLLHPATFITLALVYWPVVFKARLSLNFVFINFMLWCLYLSVISVLSIDRGSHLFSAINPVRIVVLILIPTLFYLGIIRRMTFRSNVVQNDAEFIGLITLNVALLTLYVAGIFVTSGEAIVRVYSLVAAPVMLYGLINNYSSWGGGKKIFAFLVLTINSLFFLNTVYL